MFVRNLGNVAYCEMRLIQLFCKNNTDDFVQAINILVSSPQRIMEMKKYL